MPARRLRKAGPARWLWLPMGLWLAAGGGGAWADGPYTATGPSATRVRIAISDKVVYGVSINDAKAAMAVWSTEIMKTIDLELAPHQEWVLPSSQLLAAIRGGTVDFFCLTVQEYRQVTPYVDTSRIITDDYGGEDLLLVVREGGGIQSLAELRGRSLIVQDSPNTSVAEAWLAVSLWREGLEAPEHLLGRTSKNTKLSQVVLPVFFGQADACLVTRRGLSTMFELNPQLSRKLKVLRASSRLVSAFFACRRDYPANLKKPIFDRLLAVKSSPTAKQVLTLFQSPGFAARDAECLRPANSLLEIYEQRREQTARREK